MQIRSHQARSKIGLIGYNLPVPEYPDIENYVRLINTTLGGAEVESAYLLHPFLLRTAETPIESVAQKRILSARSLGKRIVAALDGDIHLVIHLMLAGRLSWDGDPGAAEPRPVHRKRGRTELLRLRFAQGDLVLTEAGTKRRASLHLFASGAGVETLHPGGRSPFDVDAKEFSALLRSENHTIKRSLTDQRMLLGIGNTFSDEILHAARIPPLRQTGAMSDEEYSRLHAATCRVLAEWRDKIAGEWGDSWPKTVHTTRPEMAVHGRYGKPCRLCGTPVQRIQYSERECNYCPTCQNEGKLYADRALSRLLKGDWPSRVEELE